MKLSGKILYTFMISSALLMLNACDMIYEYYPEAELQDDSALLILRINKIADNATSADSDEKETVTEAIESLRIIIIDVESGKIEYNQWLNSSELNKNSEPGLLYTLTYPTTPGTKKFYLFANEESVKLSDNQTLTEFFNDITTSNKNFEESVNSLSFTPSPNYGLTDNTVKLPYSSYYELNLEAGKRYENPLFLIPAATKFTINFNNYRDYDVTIKNLSISSIADQSYILAQVGEKDYTKELDGENLYWVNWLAKISEMSHSNIPYPDNVNFNDRYGWIFDYKVPEDVNYSNKLFIETQNVDGKTEQPASDPIPGRATIGPFYYPESHCFFNIDEESKENNVIADSEEQAYYLNITIEDSDPSAKAPDIKPVRLTNLKALFRNTHVIININMDKGTDDIYVEIRNWYYTENFYGTASKEN